MGRIIGAADDEVVYYIDGDDEDLGEVGLSGDGSSQQVYIGYNGRENFDGQPEYYDDIFEMGSEDPTTPPSGGSNNEHLGLLTWIGVIFSLIVIATVMGLAFRRRYRKMQRELAIKREQARATQRARNAQMEEQRRAGNLVDDFESGDIDYNSDQYNSLLCTSEEGTSNARNDFNL